LGSLIARAEIRAVLVLPYTGVWASLAQIAAKIYPSQDNEGNQNRKALPFGG
jgi:hypothetical protein